MHATILETSHHRQDAVDKCRMRLVCNAAGGLLPSLAVQLRDTFRCTVLPSYGMTECMPISTPPIGYTLDRPGTSGMSAGPEIAVLDSGGGRIVAPQAVGRIAIRGAPVFSGYLRDGEMDRSPFTEDGWFDTGDLGYLDSDGFLFITGRSKEVINRGGELISPFEVEDAIVSAAKDLDSPLYGRVSQALAFSVPHNVLQEVVGVVLVTPRGAQRTDLRQLHQALKSSLQQAKWPILIVYMEDVPKNNNKVLRIQLHKRLNLPELNDDIPLSERHFEASCPPPNTALSIQIECSQYLVDYHWLTQMLEVWAAGQYSVLVRRDVHGFPEVIAAPDLAGHGLERTKIISDLEHRVWEYFDALYHPSRCLVLDEPFRLTREGYIDEEEVNSRLAFSQDSQLTSADGVEDRVAQKFAEVLGCSCDQLSSETDFFDAGGDSLKAGKLLALLRHEFSMRLPIDVLFSTSRLGSLSGIISKEVDSGPSVSLHDSKHDNSDSNYHRDTRSSTHILLLIIHLIPLLILYPMRRAFTWTVFAVSLSKTEMLPTANSTPGRFLNLIGSMALGKVATRFIAPFVAILLKWLVIGRYRDGLYPMWGPYHTRWWFVQKAIAVCGMGHFNMCNTTRVWYYRLLGARIGKNVSIEKGAILGEYDLIDIGDNSALDRCICRPFAAEQNTTMYLGRITIGDHCTIGLKSIVAPGSVLVDGTYIGPNSSSWESGDVTEAEHSVSPSKVASPHVLLSGLVLWPLFSFARFVRAIPWMASIYPLVSFPPIVHQNLLASILSWFSAPHRIGIHYAALIADVTLGPIFYFGVVVLLRWLMDLMFGPVVPAPAHSQSNFTKLRMELMRKLMPGDAFHEFVGLFGTHYEMTSIAVRAMAGKVGKRVYWPGTGPSVTDYGLLDIGDDVVFGSRAALVTSDASGSDYVRIGDGAMVSDRVVVLPGTTLGERTIMGSGALTRRNKSYPAHSTWIGSRDGEAINLNDGKVSYDNLEASRPLQERRRNAFYLKTPRLSSVAQWSQSVIEDALSPNRISFVLPTPSPTVSAQASPTTSTWSGSDASDDTLISHTSGDISTGYCMDLEAKRKCSMSTLRSVYSDSTLADRDEVRPDSTSSSPFGRAFYQGKAPYYVLGHIPIFVISTFAIIFVAIFWRVPTVSAVQITAQVLERSPEAVLKYVSYPPILYLLFFGLIAVIMALEVPLALAIVVGSKWLLMGRRQAGNYDWDKSSYCQRWQLFLTIERLRRSCYGGHGILGMLTGTHYAVLYFRALGATIGKDCALFAGGLPSLMFTEPDLLTLGDRVSVDDASLVCHINSRGCFNLNLLNVGDRSVLRSGSRLLSGASMGKDACLLEHTLVMAGDIVDDGVTMQRWPAEEFKGKRLPTISDTCSA